MPARTAARTGAVLLAGEALALAALVVRQLSALLAGDTDSLATAVALAVLTGIGAVAVFAFAVATWRGRSWGRSGGIVTQMLILAVAAGAVTGVYAAPAVGLMLAVPAIGTLVLLIVAVREAGREARDPASADPS